ncbi:multidrug efflux SMR transporter [Actibacterium sp. MT2.3-13A]|uniref:DMT family transporter n=1 Tax=Actibacterium sp. MT2.3-13A TaxID=2828332 RepID=UPI001BAB4CB7|nr:multidrug efflux SMR transporter [Actibacterium sp. MT2.3-13A]
MSAAWLSLIAAGLFEIGWPVGLKNGWSGAGGRPLWLLFAVFCMAASGALLLYAQRSIPIGTAYAVWTGIGAVGTFAVGVTFFGDSASALRLVSVLLIAVGVMGLKFA